jgi:hypothetical protein
VREWTTGGAAARCERPLLLGATLLLLWAGALLLCETLWLATAVVAAVCGTPCCATSPYVTPKANVVSAASASVIRVLRFIPLFVFMARLLWMRSNASKPG